ncbi:hypothetical protein EV2_034162 [Malus domestica]
MNEVLTRPLVNEEIKDAVFQMGRLKAPGPDGFQGVFFQSYWDIIEAEIKGLVAEFLNGGTSLKPLNSTNIVLIQKIPNPESVSHFQPISLCNYSYKVLSKILTNRLKPLLSDIISHSQNAFVKGRQIQDNIIIAHEVFHFLKLRKAKLKYDLGIKLDMNKVYDRVE